MLVKICGITSAEDARMALDAGADWIGLNLVGGPRRMDMESAEQIVRRVDDPSRVVTLIYLDQGRLPENDLRHLRELGIRRFQLYGEPVAPALAQLKDTACETIIVQPVRDESSLERLDERLADCAAHRPDWVLFDAAVDGQLGGTGQRANWNVIERARSAGRFGDWPDFLIAGGLTPGNIRSAIQKVTPCGIDVSSGVERAPGRKDIEKIRALVRAVRESEG